MKNSKCIIIESFFLLTIFIIAVSAQDREARLRQQIDEISNLRLDELRNMLKTCDELVERYKAANDNEHAAEICYWSFKITAEIESRSDEETYDEKYNRLKRGWNFNRRNPIINRELGLLVRNRNKEEAISYFRIAISNGDILAIEYLLQIFLDNSEVDSVLKWYPIYLSRKPNDINHWLNFADFQIEHSSRENAIRTLKEGIGLNPNSNSLKLRLAHEYKNIGMWNEVLELCNDIQPLTSEVNKLINEATANLSTRERMDEARRLLTTDEKRNWERSRNIFESILENDPQNQDALIYLRQAKNKLFTYCFEKAKSYNNQRNWQEAYAYSIMSIIYAESENDRNQAFNEFQSAALGLNKRIEARNAQQVAEQALRSGELEKARNKYILAIELYDENPPEDITKGLTRTDLSDYYNRGTKALQSGDYACAKTYFINVKKIDPRYNHIDSLINRSDSLLTWQILTEQLKKYYNIEKNNQNWRSAYGLIRLLSSINPSNIELKDELAKIKSKIISHAINRNIILIFVLIGIIIVGSVHFAENYLELRKWHKKGTNRTTLSKNTIERLDKISAILRILLAFTLFLLTEIAVILVYKNNSCFITTILSCETVLLIVALISLFFTKVYLRKKRLRQLGPLGKMILWLPPRIDKI